MPNLPAITGQILIDKCKTRMGGYANAFSSADILEAVNEAKDEVWAILKDLKKNYFVVQSQSTTPGNEDFFDKLSTTVRDYVLPTRFREMRMIECITTGFEHLAFNEMDFASPEFQQERRESSLTGVGVKGASEYMYAIVGNKFSLAQFPEAASLDLRLWFVEAIPDLALG
ncbi:MAG: hypothetical protein L0Z53_06215, partial [Acidobacteriales bacterium]|nr:hypothetical protein [Terriglobales bacterium]